MTRKLAVALAVVFVAVGIGAPVVAADVTEPVDYVGAGWVWEQSAGQDQDIDASSAQVGEFNGATRLTGEEGAVFVPQSVGGFSQLNQHDVDRRLQYMTLIVRVPNGAARIVFEEQGQRITVRGEPSADGQEYYRVAFEPYSANGLISLRLLEPNTTVYLKELCFRNDKPATENYKRLGSVGGTVLTPSVQSEPVAIQQSEGCGAGGFSGSGGGISFDFDLSTSPEKDADVGGVGQFSEDPSGSAAGSTAVAVLALLAGAILFLRGGGV